MKNTSKPKLLIAVILLIISSVMFLFFGKFTDHQKAEVVTKETVTVENKTCQANKSKTDVELTKNVKETSNIVSAQVNQKASSSDDLFGELELPQVFDDFEIMVIGTKAQLGMVWKDQDAIMSEWPAYSDIREELNKELASELDIDNLSDEKLIQTALDFRKKFWQAGGGFSKGSYEYGYKARVLMGLAHSRDPENMTTTDEFIETIQSSELMYEPGSGRDTVNKTFVETISKLRSAQFERIKKEVALGRIPIWDDFIRANDLARLLSKSGEFESALEITNWLIAEAGRGGWEYYMKPLKSLQANLKNGEGHRFKIYTANKPDFPERYRYSRRLPSFKGPDPEERGVVALHMRGVEPAWMTLGEAHKSWKEGKP
ncbi:MAG: hypothetical protein ACYTE8_02675 [Planctomycetota bacterium]|jgi:hypothetical protein